MTDEQLLVDTSDLVHIDNTETINGLKYFSRDTVVKNLSPMMTNCITEIPQHIKLELNNGIITLKAGSKVWYPDGFESDGTTPKFSYYSLDTDRTAASSTSATYTDVIIINLYDESGTYMFWGEMVDTYSGPTTPTLTGRRQYWYDTTNNIIKYYNPSTTTWYTEHSGHKFIFPIGLFSVTGGTGFTGINQVFNGLGYIGSTVFVLPGVKGLIPNGKNEDGSLKNIEFVTNKVSLNHHDDGTTPYVLFLNQTGFTADHVYYCCKTEKPVTISPDNYAWYNPKTNIILNPIDQEISGCYCISAYRTDGKITSFTSRDTFNILDYDNKSIVSGWSMPSNKSTVLTLGASGATYTAPANGYFTLFGHLNSAEIYNTSGSNLYWGVNGPSSTFKGVSCPVKKGDVVKIYYSTYGDNIIFRFIYAEGEI